MNVVIIKGKEFIEECRKKKEKKEEVKEKWGIMKENKIYKEQ